MSKYIFVILLAFAVLSCEELTDNIPEGNDRLEGIWSVNENSSVFDNKSTSTSYQAFIAVDTSSDNRIWIENFYGIEEGSIYGVVDEQSIQLPSQNFGGYTLTSGSGTINNRFDEIEWSYQVDMGDGTIDDVTATYTKQ